MVICFGRNASSLPFPGMAGMSEDEVRVLAWETGFQQRAPRKIDPAAFAAALLDLSVRGPCSFNDLAARLDEASGCLVSRQAVAARMGEPCVRFLEAILGRTLAHPGPGAPEGTASPPGRYRRILVQDSTVVQLPARLFSEFSGVSNGLAAACNARIQVVHELLGGSFVSFAVDPYSRNDQAAAADLELRPGDLALRDRGYLSADEVRRHLDAGADCIYRHKLRMTYLDPATGDPLDLPALLRKHGSLDMDVCLNNPERTPVRLVAAPVGEETANLRRMKLRKETRGHAPGKKLLELMSWTIFLTTIPRERASFRQILEIYGLRWRIETIFKTWKSELHMDCIHNVSANQLRVLLIARMIALAACVRTVFHHARERIRKRYGKELSLIKTARFVASGRTTVTAIDRALRQGKRTSQTLDSLARYCTYDSRKRRNFNQICEALDDIWPLG